MKVNQLEGVALDWAVAKCEGWVAGTNDADLVSFVLESSSDEMHFWPSTDWAQGGPIIEREGINLRALSGALWEAETWSAGGDQYLLDGPTPLIAAMRCYVSSKLGEEIEVPDELMEGASK